MPLLPLSPCGDVPDDPATCGWLFDIGQALLDQAFSGLSPFIPEPDSPCAPGVTTLVSLAAPAVDPTLADILAIWLVTLGPTAKDQRLASATTGCWGFYPALTAEWQVELWESGYPAVKIESDGSFEIPSPDLIQKVNRWLYAHGASAYNAVILGAKDGMGLPSVVSKVSIGPMQPLGPLGGAAGWGFRVTTEIG